MARALSDYYDRIVWVNFAIYSLYFLVKYITGVVLLCDVIRQKKWCEAEKKKKEQNKEEDSADKKEAEEKKKEQNKEEDIADKKEESTCCKPLPWLVILAFGKQLGLKEDSKLHKLHIKTTGAMSYCGQITIFYVIIAGSLILAFGSALDLTLFSPSHICTEDPSIDCYPQRISGANGTNLTLPVDITKPITDCSYWNSEGVSSQITFFCFEKDFNFDLFLAVFGGLLAFTFIALNAAIGLVLRITQCTCNTNAKRMFWIRMVVIGFTIVVEFAMVVLCLVLGVTRVSPDSVDDDPGITFLTMHATEILTVVGITTTLLWLPWEEYVEEQNGEAPNPVE